MPRPGADASPRPLSVPCPALAWRDAIAAADSACAGGRRPPDWNWADFIGSELLLVERRHGPRLGVGLRLAVLGARVPEPAFAHSGRAVWSAPSSAR